MTDVRRNFDVVVLGGGPAGMAAACTAAEAGRHVAVLEGTPWLGGPIWRARSRESMPRAGRRWLRRLNRCGAEVLCQTTAIGVAGPHVLRTERGCEALDIGWDRLILAAGSQELLLPFPGWTLPNVFGAGGLQVLAKTGWPLQGKRVVVAGSGPLLMAVAAYLVRHGARVTDIVEQAAGHDVARFVVALPLLAPRKILQALGSQASLLGVRYRTGCWPIAAHGEHCVERVTLGDGQRTWTRECDYLACAFGLVPSLQWPRMLGCRIDENAVAVGLWQETSVEGVFSAGEVTGIGGVDGALIEGRIAGHAAAGQQARAGRLLAARRRSRRFAQALHTAFALRDELKVLATPDTIVCRCEDVTLAQIAAYDDLRSAKLMTRCGMGPCQGRVCQNALRLLRGWGGDSVRPPVLPAHLSTLAGTARRRLRGKC